MPKVKVVDLVDYLKNNAPCWAMMSGKGDCDYYLQSINENRKRVEETYPFHRANDRGEPRAEWHGWTWSSPGTTKVHVEGHLRLYTNPIWACVLEEERNELGEICP